LPAPPGPGGGGGLLHPSSRSGIGGGAGRPPSRAVANAQGRPDPVVGGSGIAVLLVPVRLVCLDCFAELASSWWWSRRFALGVPSVGVRMWRHSGVHGCAGLLPCLEVAEAVGVCCCLSVVCVAGLGYNQAKAFTDTPVGGNGDSVPECRSPCWGHHCGPPCLATLGSQCENPTKFG
jgi:hypothetical protein